MRLAVAQTPGRRLDDWQETWDSIADLLARAAGQRADLVVLPECVWPAYDLTSKRAYFAAREAGLPGPDAFRARLAQLARQHHISICAGYVAEEGDRLANAAVLLDQDGRVLGVHRKCFLWDFDHDYFEPGQTIRPVEAPFGRVGVMVCADARLPEIPATLAARGATLMLQPTAWVNAGTPAQRWNPQPDFLIAARAAEFGVPIASASKWGVEGPTTFVGSSLICDANGRILVQAEPAETTVLVADVELAQPRRPVLTAAERTVLLSAGAVDRPRRDVSPLTMLLAPVQTTETDIAAHLHACGLADQPVLVLQKPPEAQARRATRPSPRHAILTGLAEFPVELSGVRVSVLTAEDARRFAGVRCAALGGAHLVVAWGLGATLPLLPARACENRIFVVSADAQGATVFDPRGVLLAELAWPLTLSAAPSVALDVRAAADKLVAPRTDVIGGRRPAQYDF